MSRSFSYNIKTPSSIMLNTRKSVSSDIQTQRGVTINTRRSIGIQTPRNDTKTGGVFHMTLKH